MKKCLLVCVLLCSLCILAFTACGQVEFNIHFIVEGEVYATVSTGGREVIKMPSNPKKTGYIFDGWYWDKDVWMQPFTANSLLDAPLSDDMNVYAKWVSEDGSEETKFEIKDFQQTDGYSYTLTVSNATTTVFLGTYVKVQPGCSWVLVADVSGNETIASKTVTLSEGNNVYYVLVSTRIGEAIPYSLNIYRKHRYNVIFDTKGGSKAEKQMVEEGELAQEPSITKEGYTLVGWDYDFSTPITDNVIISAIWKHREYRITYDAQGGQVGKEFIKAEYGENYALDTPTRDEYVFDGWYYNGVLCEDGVYGFENDITLVARWKRVEYTVTYENLHGAVNDNVTTYTIDDDSIVLLDVKAVGYTFVGWTDEQERPVASVDTQEKKNRVLTANWEIITYTITYEDSQNAVNGNTTEYTIETPTFLLSGLERFSYDFMGWTENGQTITQITVGTTGDKILVANWTPTVYTITYENTLGAKNNNATTYTVESGKIDLLPIACDGYVFTGWTDEAASLTEAIEAGTYGNRVFTANWDLVVYSIGYELDGGAYVSTGNATEYTVESDPIPFNALEKTGYDFLGWFDQASGGTQFTGLATGNFGDKVFYAHWTPTVYTIMYTLNGGDVSGNPTTYTVETADFSLQNPSKRGYTFIGWDGTDLGDSETSVVIVRGSMGNRSYTATYKAIEYGIHYNLKDGVNAGENPVSYTIEDSVSLSVPSKNGYTFIGWTGTSLDQKTLSVTIPTGSIGERTFTANWQIVTYAITYVLNGGTDSSANPVQYTIETNDIVLAAPNRVGYDFVAWTDEQGKNITQIAQGNYGNRTITANWQAKTYEVTFDANGGTVAPESKVATYDSEFEMPAPSRVGYDFDAWENRGVAYSDGIWKVADDITLSARWIARNDTVYTVRHYQQNADDDEYVLVYTDSLRGTSDTTVTLRTKEYDGFVSPDERTGRIAADGSAVFEYRYDRIIYGITYITNGGNDIGRDMFKYEQDISLLTNAVRTGYTFGGWFRDASLNIPMTLTKMPSNRLTLYAYWSEENKPTDFAYSMQGEISVTSYIGTTPNVVIPRYIGGKKVVSISDGAFKNNENIESVIMPNFVVSIGQEAFMGCILLQKVVTSSQLNTIGTKAFSGCSSLSQFNSDIEGELIIPNKVNVIEEYVFENVVSITDIVVPDAVYEIKNWAFKGCESIEDITIPFVGQKEYVSGITSGVFGYIFGYWGTAWAPESTTQYSYHWKNEYGGGEGDYYYRYTIPKSIKNVTITRQESIPRYAFNNCSWLETIVIPVTVSSIGENAFNNCSATVLQTYISTSTGVWNGEIATGFHDGDGTEANPYQIFLASELAYLASSVNAGNSYDGQYFELAAKIDLGNLRWTPIGTQTAPFRGDFDGNQKVIRRLNLSMGTTYNGLFGYVEGTIKNLGVESGTASINSSAGTAYVGSLAGYLTGKVQNCYSLVSISISGSSTYYGGGLIGYAESSALIKNSYAQGDVTVTSNTAFSYAGGLVGMNNGKLQGCVAYGNVEANGGSETTCRNGGLVGMNTGTIEDCYRDNAQVLVRKTVANSWYNSDGTIATKTEIMAYCEANWGSKWIYSEELPEFK